MTIVNNLLLELSNDNSLLAPIELTANALEAKAILAQLIDGLPAGPLQDYIMTGVKYDVHTCAQVINNRLVPNDLSSISTFNLPDYYDSVTSGVYQMQAGTDSYVGSSGNLYSRVFDHVGGLQGVKKPYLFHGPLLDAAGGNWENIDWGSIYTSTSYADQAIQGLKPYVLSDHERYVLRAHTQFLPKVLEQSIITEFGPSLNKGLVTFDVWRPTPGAIRAKAAVPIAIVDMYNNIMQQFPSVESACNILDVPRQTLTRWISLGYKLFYVSLGMKVMFVTLNNAKSSALNPISTAPLTLPQGPLTSLTPNAFWLFSPNKIDYLGPFRSLLDVARSLYPSTLINKDVPASTKALGPLILSLNRESLVNGDNGKFYVVCNPNKPPRNYQTAAAMPKVPFFK